MKLISFICLCSSLMFAATVKQIDSGSVDVSLKNNQANILTFPFLVEDAKLATSFPESFSMEAKKDSIAIIVQADSPAQKADLVVWSQDGYAYLLKLDTTGREQVFNFTSNRVQPKNSKTSSFESGKIDNDVKVLLKKAILSQDIPGYKKVKVKRQFNTRDLLLQKEFMFNGSKYRVEQWLIKNKTNEDIKLDEGNFYTKGILAISFESQTIPVNKIGTMWLIVDKSSTQEKGE